MVVSDGAFGFRRSAVAQQFLETIRHPENKLYQAW